MEQIIDGGTTAIVGVAVGYALYKIEQRSEKKRIETIIFHEFILIYEDLTIHINGAFEEFPELHVSVLGDLSTRLVMSKSQFHKFALLESQIANLAIDAVHFTDTVSQLCRALVTTDSDSGEIKWSIDTQKVMDRLMPATDALKKAIRQVVDQIGGKQGLEPVDWSEKDKLMPPKHVPLDS